MTLNAACRRIGVTPKSFMAVIDNLRLLQASLLVPTDRQSVKNINPFFQHHGQLPFVETNGPRDGRLTRCDAGGLTTSTTRTFAKTAA